MVDGLTEGGTPTYDPAPAVVPEITNEDEPYKKIALSVSLSRFAVELFTREPELVWCDLNYEDFKFTIVIIQQSVDGGKVQVIDDQYKLTCFQLVSGSVCLAVYSNDNVQLQMAILDLAIIDEQPEQQGKTTG